MPLFTGPTFTHDLDVLTVGLSQVLFPVVLLLGLNGLLVGVLQSYEHFTIPAISPAVWNVVIIVLLVVLHPHFHGGEENGEPLYALAIAILVATFVQLGMAVGALGRIDFRLQFHIDWHDPRIRQVFMLMLPVTIGLGIVNLDQLINSVFGTLVSKEAPRAIDNAFRIYMLPQGLFSVAVATVLFPTLSRMAAHRDVRAMRRALGIGMRQINLLLIPAAAFLIVLAEPIVRLLFQRGEFNAAVDAPRLDRAVLVRLQPAVRRPQPAAHARLLRRPAAVDPDAPGGDEHRRGHRRLDRALQAARHRRADHRHGRRERRDDVRCSCTGCAMASTGASKGAQTTMITARIPLASALLAGVSWVVWKLLDRLLGTSLAAQIVSVGAAGVAGAFVYVRAVLAMHVPEAHQVARLIRSQFGRA